MKDYTSDEVREALRPIASLLSKSEKARQKLAPGSWQEAMLRDNIKALQLASALINGETDGATVRFAQDDLQKALGALASMINRTGNALAKFAPGTSQHTLQTNRLKALGIAQAFIKAALDETDA